MPLLRGAGHAGREKVLTCGQMHAILIKLFLRQQVPKGVMGLPACRETCKNALIFGLFLAGERGFFAPFLSLRWKFLIGNEVKYFAE